jgi:CBS domain-containing protein
MYVATKLFTSLTAADLMSRELTAIPRHLSLRTAAHLLSQAHVSGAPVVDDLGACVGVISSTDFVHWAEGDHTPGPDTPQGECACSEWQVFEPEELPTEEVANYMTPDPVTAKPHATIGELARMMIDAHIHRVIIVDERNRPVGIVSSTDILGAVASSEYRT